jgi:hypothetical protein
MVEERQPASPLGNFLFPRIFQTFRMSIQPTKLILAFLALTVVCLTGRFMDEIPRVAHYIDPNLVPVEQAVVVKADGETELDVYVKHGMRMTLEHIRLFGPDHHGKGVFETLWAFGSAKFSQALSALSKPDIGEIVTCIRQCLLAPLWAITFHPVFSVVFFAISLVALALAGGALCRITALQFARGEKPGLIEALRFSAAKFSSFVTAPLIPIGIIAAMGIMIVALGLLGNAPYVGELSVGLFLPLALAMAAPITMFLIGAVAGFNIMFPSVAYEDSDGFDAVSRSFSYIYARPWHMGFYTVIAFIYGAICYAFVRLFSLLLLYVTRVFLSIGFLAGDAKLDRIWPRPLLGRFLGPAQGPPIGWGEQASTFMVDLWVLAVMGLMVSFVISFFFTANTIIYALMRHGVDKTSLAEVHTRSDEMAADRVALEAEVAEPPAEPKTDAQPETPDK